MNTFPSISLLSLEVPYVSELVRSGGARPSWIFGRSMFVLEGSQGRSELQGDVYSMENSLSDTILEARYNLFSVGGDRSQVLRWLRTSLALLLDYGPIFDEPIIIEVHFLTELAKCLALYYFMMGRLGTMASVFVSGEFSLFPSLQF